MRLPQCDCGLLCVARIVLILVFELLLRVLHPFVELVVCLRILYVHALVWLQHLPDVRCGYYEFLVPQLGCEVSELGRALLVLVHLALLGFHVQNFLQVADRAVVEVAACVVCQ